MPVVSDLRGAVREQPLQAGVPAVRLLHELRGLLLDAVSFEVCGFEEEQEARFDEPPHPMLQITSQPAQELLPQ